MANARCVQDPSNYKRKSDEKTREKDDGTHDEARNEVIALAKPPHFHGEGAAEDVKTFVPETNKRLANVWTIEPVTAPMSSCI
jgi:hypothetical protein